MYPWVRSSEGTQEVSHEWSLLGGGRGCDVDGGNLEGLLEKEAGKVLDSGDLPLNDSLNCSVRFSVSVFYFTVKKFLKAKNLLFLGTYSWLRSLLSWDSGSQQFGVTYKSF